MICNDRKEITFVQVGFPGSVHDSSRFRETAVYQNPENFFSADEYIMADSAYPLKHWLITPYKGRAANDVENVLFNTMFSKFRIRVEHVMGLLKNRWTSLRGLRCSLSSVDMLQPAIEWIVSVMILHNVMINCNDDWEGDENGIVLEEINDDRNDLNIVVNGIDRREELKRIVLG